MKPLLQMRNESFEKKKENSVTQVPLRSGIPEVLISTWLDSCIGGAAGTDDSTYYYVNPRLMLDNSQTHSHARYTANTHSQW